MYDKYNKSVQFYVVYIKEAHALDSRSPMVGGNSDASITDGIPTWTSGRPKMAASAAYL